MARVGVTLVSLAGAMTCPGSPAFLTHAGMKITATAQAPCDTVKGEINARLSGVNGWYDQHNRGTYTAQNYGGSVSATRLTGDGKYTDKMIFELSGSGSSCTIEACSESQVTSVLDGGTNYCELKLLYCGSAEGCKVANTDFTNSGEQTEARAGASTGMSNCLKALELEAKQCDTQCKDLCNQPYVAGGPDCCGACGCPEEDCPVPVAVERQCDTQCRDVCNQPFTAGGPDCCGACGCPEEDCPVPVAVERQCDTQCRDVCNQPFTAGGPDCCGACGCPEEDCPAPVAV